MAITSQTIYVCGVHRIIRELLRLVVPNLAENSAYIRNDAEFRARIESAMVEVPPVALTSSDFRRRSRSMCWMAMMQPCNRHPNHYHRLVV